MLSSVMSQHTFPNLQAPTARPQHARQDDLMQLSRVSEKAFVMLAGGDLQMNNSYDLLGIPCCERALP